MKAKTKSILVQGLVTGFIGYAVIVGFFFIANLIQGRPPFYTVAVLGGTLFYGWTGPEDVEVWAGPVLAYNGAHLLVFLLIGMIAAWLAAESEGGPQFWYLGISFFIFGLIHIFGAILWLGGLVRAVLPALTVVTATLLAAVAMAAYLWRMHPALRRAFHEYEDQPQ
ncbi:MAG: hypothetical protein ACODAE_03730 [Gemmatimonadota bacterium]